MTSTKQKATFRSNRLKTKINKILGMLDSFWFARFNTRHSTDTNIVSREARIAQSVEQGIENPRVGGSIPPPGTIFEKASLREAFFVSAPRPPATQARRATLP